MLNLKSGNPVNWIGYAVSHHLCGNPKIAMDILNSYMDTLDKNRPLTYEESEIYLYQNELLEEIGEHEKTLEHLEVRYSRFTPSIH